jgi:hypothetical protein
MKLDPKIWGNLPYDIVRLIIEKSCPSIDVQLAFKIDPKKLNEGRCWRLWFLLKSHDGIVYNLDTQTLHNFRIPGFHIIRRNIELSYYTAGLWIFNAEQKEYMLETTGPSGIFAGKPETASWITELRVLLRGSSISRTLNAFEGWP